MYDHDYRICYPDRKIFISRNHQWAFAAWATGREAGWIGDNVTLLHVDAHLDDTWDGVLAEGLHEMKTVSDFMAVADRLEIDNFIWAGFAASLIDRIVYVCPFEVDASDPFDLSSWDLEGEQLQPIKQLIARRAYEGFRLDSVAQLQQQRGEDILSQIDKLLNLPGSVILDLDLDVFKLSPNDPTDDRLLPESQIRNQLRFLKQYHNYDMITVALSPSFCGGDENSTYLLQLFLEVFGLDSTAANTW
jgi:hypothetical protein